MKSAPRRRCKKCKSKSLRYEPACVVCMICSWVHYCDGGIVERLWRQHVLNRQYMSNSEWVLNNSLYHVTQKDKIEREKLHPTNDARVVYFSSTRTHPNTVSFHPHSPRSFIEKEIA